MKDDTRKQLSTLIIEELAERIRQNENLRRKLEPFTDLPVEKVAEAIIKQFEYLLSSDLRDLILYLIEQEIKTEQAGSEIETFPKSEPVSINETEKIEKEKLVEEDIEELKPSEHVMEKFSAKEPFEYKDIDFEINPDDWFYSYAFCYAPNSTGKGVPSKQLLMQGVDHNYNIFVVDYGDIRLFLNKLSIEKEKIGKMNKPAMSTDELFPLKYEHEKILNTLRVQEWIVPLQFWTITQGMDQIIKQIEDKYVDMLKTLIDVHDAIEWDIDVYAFDEYLIQHPAVAGQTSIRTKERESRHPKARGKDIKALERLMIREKNMAQEIHSQLLLHASKAKIDFMVRLDNAFMDDWKSILAVRYTVGKDKRKNFCQTIRSMQTEYEDFKLMFKVSNPNTKFYFS